MNQQLPNHLYDGETTTTQVKQKCCSLKCLEITCFIFAFSFVFAAFYYFPHAIDTGAAWTITSIVCGLYAMTLRRERLNQDFPLARDTKTFRVTQGLVLMFLIWSIANGVSAGVNGDGVEPESKWMTFISSMMGLKWSTILVRTLKKYREEPVATASRRALLSPIGEIA
jgi:hypothetical protein